MDSTIASLIDEVERGDRSAVEPLFDALYAELRRLARRELARHGYPMSLGATTVLHEAYIAMAGREDASFPDRARFMKYAACVMRGLIIDHARHRGTLKRGGQFEITSLGTEPGPGVLDEREAAELARIGEALDELAALDPELASIVDLKFFCGFSFVEIAAMQGVSERTVQRKWEKARILLHRSIRADLDA